MASGFTLYSYDGRPKSWLLNKKGCLEAECVRNTQQMQQIRFEMESHRFTGAGKMDTCSTCGYSISDSQKGSHAQLHVVYTELDHYGDWLAQQICLIDAELCKLVR